MSSPTIFASVTSNSRFNKPVCSSVSFPVPYANRLGVLLLLLWGMGGGPVVWAQHAVPTLTGPVVDQAEILSPATEETLTALLAVHEDSTSNQVAVLTVRTLGGESIEAYALRVAETWGLGTAEQDNGVLLVVASEDRKLRIEVGYGLEGLLPDVIASRIIREQIVPYFREGNFERGVEVGVLAILMRLVPKQEPGVVTTEDEDVADTVVEPVPSSFIDPWQVYMVGYFLALLVLALVAAAVALLEEKPGRYVIFILLLPCFFVVGRSLAYTVFWSVHPMVLGLSVAGVFALLYWRMMVRLDTDSTFKKAWQRHLLRHGAEAAREAEKEGREEKGAAAPPTPVDSDTPRRIQILILVVFVVQLGLFVGTRWLSVLWLVVGALLAWFSLSRIAETAERRKRRGKTVWTPLGRMPSLRSYRGRSSRSSSRSYSSPSRSSWSSSSSSSYSSSSSSSYSSSSSSSYSGGGGSFGGGGASGSW